MKKESTNAMLLTAAQKGNYNTMLAALKQIAKEYQTPTQLRKSANKDYGLSYEEILEMAYENIQLTAARAIKGKKML